MQLFEFKNQRHSASQAPNELRAHSAGFEGRNGLTGARRCAGV